MKTDAVQSVVQCRQKYIHTAGRPVVLFPEESRRSRLRRFGLFIRKIYATIDSLDSSEHKAHVLKNKSEVQRACRDSHTLISLRTFRSVFFFRSFFVVVSFLSLLFFSRFFTFHMYVFVCLFYFYIQKDQGFQ